MEKIGDSIKKAVLKFFMLDIPSFKKLVIKKEVIEDMMQFAKIKHPQEFIAIIDGKVKDNILTIDSIYYQSFVSSENSAVMNTFFPPATRGVGSVHSHPSSNTRPSRADLQFFGKRGIVHLIIGYPYEENSIAAYDLDGNRIDFEIR